MPEKRPEAAPERADASPAEITATPAASESSKKKNNKIDLTALPLGEQVKTIKIPYYAEDGVSFQMLLSASEAERINDTDIKMKDLVVQARDDDGKKFTASFATAILNIETKILTGENNVLVEREDFHLTGDKAEIDLDERFAKVLGNVQMTILNLEEQQQ